MANIIWISHADKYELTCTYKKQIYSYHLQAKLLLTSKHITNKIYKYEEESMTLDTQNNTWVYIKQYHMKLLTAWTFEDGVNVTKPCTQAEVFDVFNAQARQGSEFDKHRKTKVHCFCHISQAHVQSLTLFINNWKILILHNLWWIFKKDCFSHFITWKSKNIHLVNEPFVLFTRMYPNYLTSSKMGIRACGLEIFISDVQSQGEWVTNQQHSSLIFRYKLLVHLNYYILIQTSSQSDIWLQRYGQFFEVPKQCRT